MAQAHSYAARLEEWKAQDKRNHMAHQAQLSSNGGVHAVTMAHRPIPGTQLFVSPICLGTMTFGTPVGQEAATSMIKRALELGINFIDTANMYLVSPATTENYYSAA